MTGLATRRAYVADIRESVTDTLDTMLEDLRDGKVRLTKYGPINLTAGPRSKKVVGDLFADFEPIGSLINDPNKGVIIAYRTPTGEFYGFGYYREDLKLCQPYGANDVVVKMAPGTLLHITQRHLLLRTIETLARPR